MDLTEEQKKINAEVLVYASRQLLKQVKRGECYDFAEEALKTAKALTAADIMGKENINPDAEYIWGTEITISDVQPGDIIQFRNYKMTYDETRADGGGEVGSFEANHHTAIVEAVTDRTNNVFKVLHQNTPQGRVVVSQNLAFESKSFDGEVAFVQQKTTYNLKGKIKLVVGGSIKYYRPKGVATPVNP